MYFLSDEVRRETPSYAFFNTSLTKRKHVT